MEPSVRPVRSPAAAIARIAARSVLVMGVVALVAACGAPPAGTSATSGSLTLYTSVTQDTVDALNAAFARRDPAIHVDVFRAPTGQVDARIAGEVRSGGVKGDVLWATDPFSAAADAQQGLLRAWTPSNAADLPADLHTDSFWGSRILNLVIVTRHGLASPPKTWADLLSPALRGKVAIPDPGFAGSAFAALAYFSQAPGLGVDFYRRLKQNGAVQVSAIGDVITGVAQGRFDAGISLDKSVRDAMTQGSPIDLVWPSSGAIALYSPVAILKSERPDAAARAYVEFILGSEGQAAIASTGWEPIRAGLADTRPGPQVSADWASLFAQQRDLLAEYRQIFGGG